MNNESMMELKKRINKSFIEELSRTGGYARVSDMGDDSWVGYKKGIRCWLVDQGSISRGSLTKRVMMKDQASAVARYFDIRSRNDFRPVRVVTSKLLQLLNILK